MPGRIVRDECFYVPLDYEHTQTPEYGHVQSSSNQYKEKLDLGKLVDPEDATFRGCFTYGNYFGSFFYKPIWTIATVYEGRAFVGSAQWFTRGEIIYQDFVVPVDRFKIFCAERP